MNINEIKCPVHGVFMKTARMEISVVESSLINSPTNVHVGADGRTYYNRNSITTNKTTLHEFDLECDFGCRFTFNNKLLDGINFEQLYDKT